MIKLFPKVVRSDLAGVMESASLSEVTRQLLKNAVRYQIDNVASYYWKHPDAEAESTWDLGNIAYFPSLAPPHAVTWFEWEFDHDMCNVTIDTGELSFSNLLGMQVGCLVNSLDRQKLDYPLNDLQFKGKPDHVRWLLQIMTFVSHDPQLDIMFAANTLTYVCNDGACLVLPNGRADSVINVKRLVPGFSLPNDHAMAQSMSEHIKPCFLAMSFLAANNTIIVDHNPLKATIKKKRKRPKIKGLKQAKGPGLTVSQKYRTLEIAPLKTAIRERGRSGASGSQGKRKPVPIVRGHFKTYTEDKPMFGRPGMHGTYWIPARIMGQGKDRTIKLD